MFFCYRRRCSCAHRFDCASVRVLRLPPSEYLFLYEPDASLCPDSSVARQRDNVSSMPLTLLPHIRLTLPTQRITTELIRTNTATVRAYHPPTPTCSRYAVSFRALEERRHFSPVREDLRDLLDPLECTGSTW